MPIPVAFSLRDLGPKARGLGSSWDPDFRDPSLPLVEFPSFPDFAEQYVVRASDEAAARALFHPGVVDYLMKTRDPYSSLRLYSSPGSGFWVWGGGEWLVFIRVGLLTTAQALRAFFDSAVALVQLFPRPTRGRAGGEVPSMSPASQT